MSGLKQSIDAATDRGSFVMISQSHSTGVEPHENEVVNLYEHDSRYNVTQIRVKRAINCKGDKRGEITEAVITNY